MLSAALALVAVSSCKNRPPYVPAVPTGPEYCFKGTTYTFKVIAADPEGDSVAARFDWGDSTPSDWSGWFASGRTIALTHAWSDTGIYEVRAWAEDKKEHTSGASSGLMVHVALHRPPDTPAKPSGPDTGIQDSSCTFTTVASLPDGFTVAIRFAWGDGDTSDWSAFVASGESVKMSHAWSVPGAFEVTAQARDTGNALSQWSSLHDIVIRPDTLRWRYGTGGGVISSPAIGPDGMIYVGSYDSCLHAVNPQGVLRWRYHTGNLIWGSPVIAADGTVYIGSDDGFLYALNPDGSLKWSHGIGDSVTCSPAIGSDGAVYVGSYDGNLYALRADGSVEWQYPIPWGIAGSPAIATDGTLYFGSYDTVYAVNADGTPRWRCRVGGFPGPAAVAADGTIYVGSRDSGLYAINPNGTAKWRCPVSGQTRSEPAIRADGTIYVGSSDDYLNALNPDGTPKWRYQTGGSVLSTPAIAADGTVYVGSDDSYIYTVNADGTLKWKYLTGGDVRSSPAIAADGTIYVGSSDFYLYALWSSSPLADSPWPKFHHDLRNTGRVGGGK